MVKSKKQNKVEGKGLGNEQTVPTETVNSPNIKDRRRHNDDSKHEDKVKMEEEKLARQKEASEALRDHSSQDPNWWYHNMQAHGTYTDASWKNLVNMPQGGPSSTPREKLIPMELHLNPEENDRLPS
jgi:hypothetical protein